MSYIVLKVYSFECDAPHCLIIAEVGPEANLRAAERILRHNEGWSVRSGEHFCSEHKHTHGGIPIPHLSGPKAVRTRED